MTFEDLQRMKRVSDPQISASGKWVLFSVTDVSLAANSKVNHLWVVPMTGGAEVQVTAEAGESNGRFSPDGRWVSWTADDAQGNGQIVLAAWDDAAGTVGLGKALTQVSTGADGAVWSPDSKRLLFVSSVYPECSDLGEWAKEDACDRAKDEAAAKSPVKAQVWDSLLYRHWNAFTGKKRSHVLVVSRANGEDIRDLTPASVVGDAETPTFSLGGPLGYAWAPGSEEIAFVANLDKVPAASTNNDVFTLLLDDKGAKPRKISTSLGSDDGPQYSPDGKYIAFRSQARAGYESDRFRLMLFDREKNTLQEKTSQNSNGGWVDEFVWSLDSRSMYLASGYHGVELIRRQSVVLNSSYPALRVTGHGEFSSLAVSPSGEGVIATAMYINRPSEIVKVVGWACATNYADTPGSYIEEPNLEHNCVEGDPTQPITRLNDALLQDLSLAKMEPYWFAGAEDTEVQGFIVRPPNFDPDKKYPLKFLIHGGPQGAWGDAWSYRWNAELMAADGYVVVMVNPRGSTGYGQAFIDGVNGDWGGKAYIDLMRGLDAAEAKFPFIDKTRECALGESYGGFMANWILTHTNRFACIVTHDGMYNPASAYGDTEEMWFNEWEFRRAGDFPQGTKAGEPGQPWRYAALPASEDPFRKWSPMLHIENAKTPTLVIHSQKDYRLDVSEGFQLFTALQRLGVPSKMLYFPDEGHWVLKPQNSKLWYETVGDWCDRWTKSGRYAVSPR